MPEYKDGESDFSDEREESVSEISASDKNILIGRVKKSSTKKRRGNFSDDSAEEELSEEQLKRTKKFAIIRNCILAVIACFIGYILIGGMSAYSNDRDFYLFGVFNFNIVQQHSPDSDVETDDFVICLKKNIGKIKVGDDIMFVSDAETISGDRIRAVGRVTKVEDENGEVTIFSQSVNTSFDESSPSEDIPVTKENLVGVKVFNSAFLGVISNFLLKPINWLFIGILILTVYAFISFMRKIYKYGKLV